MSCPFSSLRCRHEEDADRGLLDSPPPSFPADEIAFFSRGDSVAVSSFLFPFFPWRRGYHLAFCIRWFRPRFFFLLPSSLGALSPSRSNRCWLSRRASPPNLRCRRHRSRPRRRQIPFLSLSSSQATGGKLCPTVGVGRGLFPSFSSFFFRLRARRKGNRAWASLLLFFFFFLSHLSYEPKFVEDDIGAASSLSFLLFPSAQRWTSNIPTLSLRVLSTGFAAKPSSWTQAQWSRQLVFPPLPFAPLSYKK